MTPGDFKGFTPDGLDALRRALELARKRSNVAAVAAVAEQRPEVQLAKIVLAVVAKP